MPEYFIHQPEMKKPSEFRGWRRSPSGGISEILPDAQGGLFSETLNLLFRWEDILPNEVRLLRPYLPDGTPITTSMEEERLRIEEQRLRIEEQRLRMEAEARAEEETERRQALEAELERFRTQLADRQDRSS